MPVARDRSRLVKLILPMASTIGRASNLVMSICSTGLDRSSALRVSLILDSEFIPNSNSARPLRAGEIKAGMSFSFPEGTASPSVSLQHSRRRVSSLQQNHVGAALLVDVSVQARHRLIADDARQTNAEAVELGPHRTAIGAEHPDLDIIARTDVARKLEGPSHVVEIVAGRTVEAERHVADVRFLLAHLADRVAPSDVGGIEQSTVGALVDIQLIAAALLDAHQKARIFGAQGTARLAPKLGRIADRKRFERLVDDREIGFERWRLHARVPGREASTDVHDE